MHENYFLAVPTSACWQRYSCSARSAPSSVARAPRHAHRFGKLSWRHVGTGLNDFTVEFTSVIAW